MRLVLLRPIRQRWWLVIMPKLPQGTLLQQRTAQLHEVRPRNLRTQNRVAQLLQVQSWPVRVWPWSERVFTVLPWANWW